MKILIVGELDIPWSTNVSMKQSLEKLGHAVTPFSYRTVAQNLRNKVKFSNINKLLDKGTSFLRSDRIPYNSGWYFRRSGRRKMNQLLLQTVKEKKYDLVLLCKTDEVDYNILPDINKYAPVWYYFMDPMDVTLQINAKAYAKNSAWASATFSDVANYFKKSGANAYWITQGVDAEIFTTKNVPKVYDIVFIGTKTAKRSQYINALRKDSISVTCFGDGWGNGPIYQEELVDIYRKSRIVLNFCRPGSGFSIRVFQVMGTGAFLLSEYCPDLEEFFERGEHLDWFKTGDEMIVKAGRYLKDNERLKKISENGCKLVHHKYSWEKIMEKILEIFHNKNQRQ